MLKINQVFFFLKPFSSFQLLPRFELSLNTFP